MKSKPWQSRIVMLTRALTIWLPISQFIAFFWVFWLSINWLICFDLMLHLFESKPIHWKFIEILRQFLRKIRVFCSTHISIEIMRWNQSSIIKHKNIRSTYEVPWLRIAIEMINRWHRIWTLKHTIINTTIIRQYTHQVLTHTYW